MESGEAQLGNVLERRRVYFLQKNGKPVAISGAKPDAADMLVAEGFRKKQVGGNKVGPWATAAKGPRADFATEGS